MSDNCPHCGQAMQGNPTEELREWCENNGYWISPDGRVAANVAALILNVSPLSLRNWRYEHRGPMYFRRGKKGPVTYKLDDLADCLRNQQRE